MLDILAFLDGPCALSSTLLSRKPAHRSASDSLLPEMGVGSEKNSAFRDGVLGVL